MSSYQLNDLLVTPALTTPKAIIVLAHGSGAGMRHTFMESLAVALAQHNFEVIRFNFVYMQLAEDAGKPRPPSKMPVLIAAMQEVVSLVATLEPSLPIVIAGKSMGARVASHIISAEHVCHESVVASVSYGYPFHPPGKPEKLRLTHFDSLTHPHLILQGSRDPFGKEAEVKKYPVGENTQLNFIESGEHSFIPLKSAGTTQQALIQYAAQQTSQFLTPLLGNATRE